MDRCYSLLLAGQEVVVDRRNHSAIERAKFIALAQQSQGAICVLACTLHSSLHVCMRSLVGMEGATEKRVAAKLNRCLP